MFKRLFIYIITLLLFTGVIPFLSTYSLAAEIPERSGLNVLDPEQLFAQPEKNNLRDKIMGLAHEYVILFLSSLDEEGEAFAQKVFEQYELGADDILLVVTTDEEAQLFTAYGNHIAELGLTVQTLEERQKTIFQPYVREKKFITGISMLLDSLELELADLSKKKEREASLVVTQSTDDTETKNSTSLFNLSWWIILLGILFVLILSFLLYSIYFRRKVTRKVDELEAWKIEIEQRPFTSQLSRIKGLTLAGETEQKFEKWRAEWELILNNTLPEIEERLIDIEEEADRYRFFKTKKMLQQAKRDLVRVEEDLAAIIKEIDELTSNEKYNREKSAQLHEKFQTLKASLHKNSYSLGISYPTLQEDFKQTMNAFDQYTEAQEGGDYLLAKTILENIDGVFVRIEVALQEIPDLLKKIEEEMPIQWKELEINMKEMEEKGFILQHTPVEAMFQELIQGKVKVVEAMQKADIAQMKEWMEAVEQEIEAIYVILEKEVEAKQMVLSTIGQIVELMQEVEQQYEQIVYEANKTKQSYTWEEEWETELQEIKQAYSKLVVLQQELQSKADVVKEIYPQLYPKVQIFLERRSGIFEKLEAFTTLLNQLREEELQAIEALQKFKQTLVKMTVMLRESNLPGIPDHLASGLTIAGEAVDELEQLLYEVPLDMHKINRQLAESKTQMESVKQVVNAVVEQAGLAEQLIPFANRYRRKPEVRELLNEAEYAFRHWQYREAVELAEEALDLADKHWREVFYADEQEVI